MKLFQLLPLFLVLNAPVAITADEVGVMAGHTYCAMRENGATHSDAFRQAYLITGGAGRLTPQQQAEQMNLFAIVVIDRCLPYAKDFESFNR